jgi:aquaporin Z
LLQKCKSNSLFKLLKVLVGISRATVVYLIASGKPGFELGGFAANGYGEQSPGGYSLGAAFITDYSWCHTW